MKCKNCRHGIHKRKDGTFDHYETLIEDDGRRLCAHDGKLKNFIGNICGCLNIKVVE